MAKLNIYGFHKLRGEGILHPVTKIMDWYICDYDITPDKYVIGLQHTDNGSIIYVIIDRNIKNDNWNMNTLLVQNLQYVNVELNETDWMMDISTLRSMDGLKEWIGGKYNFLIK